MTRKERFEAMSHAEQWAEIQREASEWFKKQAKEKKGKGDGATASKLKRFKPFYQDRRRSQEKDTTLIKL